MWRRRENCDGDEDERRIVMMWGVVHTATLPKSDFLERGESEATWDAEDDVADQHGWMDSRGKSISDRIFSLLSQEREKMERNVRI